MRKHILIIGNNNGLPGVNIDCENYRKFFMSYIGGCWHEDEITTLNNTTTDYLNRFLNKFKKEKLDYFITIFSGHGGSYKMRTVLELSENNDVDERVFNDISNRQLSIFDCCRSIISEEIDMIKASRATLLANRKENFVEVIRKKYDEKIMSSLEYHTKLYACAWRETSSDTSEGGAYSSCLLRAAKNITEEYKTVGTAHIEARNDVKKLGFEQNPEAILPRCLSSQQLILSINPYFITRY